MRKVSIIGSNSFLAKNLIQYLSDYPDQYELYLYDWNECDCSPNYTRIDFSRLEDVRRIRYDVDAMFVFIGRTGGVQGFDEYRSFIEVNEVYFLNILKCCCEQAARPRIIYPGTRLIYRESEDLISEDSQLNPRSIYAATKLSCENYLKIYKDTYGLDYVILRICTPYGTLVESKGSYGTFEVFWNQALKEKRMTVFGDGNQRKTYTQMADICEAFKRLMDADTIEFESYNLGGQALTINDVVEVIARESNADIVHIPWPKLHKVSDGGTVVFDSSRFDNEFGMTYQSIL